MHPEFWTDQPSETNIEWIATAPAGDVLKLAHEFAAAERWSCVLYCCKNFSETGSLSPQSHYEYKYLEALACEKRYQYAHAIERFEDALTLGDKLFGPGGQRQIEILQRLARLRLECNTKDALHNGTKVVAPITVAEKALSRQEATLGSLHIDLVTTLCLIVECCQYPRQVRNAESRALEAARRAVRVLEHNYAVDAAELGSRLYAVSVEFQHLDEGRLSIGMLERSASIFEKHDLAGKRWSALSRLASVLQLHRRNEEAKELETYLKTLLR